MMKGFCKSSRVLLSVICCFIGIAGCGSISGGDLVIDLRKAPKDKNPISLLYDRIELIALDNLKKGAAFVPSLTKLSVTADRFFFKCGDSIIVSYMNNGSFADVLSPGKMITDYSVYRDSILDVLSDKEILSYSLSDYSLKQSVTVDTPVELTRIARHENVINISGYLDTQQYICKYYFDKKYFGAAEGKISNADIRRVIENMSYFYSNDHLLALYPCSGRIWEYGDDFNYIFFDPDVKSNKDDVLEFRSAQVTDSKVYFSLLLNGEEHLVIIDRGNNKNILIKTTKEGVHLPVGVIRDGVNYVLCTAADLPRYLTRDLLDSQCAESMDSVIKNNNNVVLKYYLSTP